MKRHEDLFLLTTKLIKKASVFMTQNQNNMPRHYQQLQADEHGEIEALSRQDKTAHTIAKILHRSTSTITRELARGTTTQIDSQRHRHCHAYFAETGEAVYRKHRANCHPKGLLKKAIVFFKSLTRALKANPRIYNVDTYIDHFKKTYPGFPCPSVPTVYRYIDQGCLTLRNHDLPKKLRRRIKRPGRLHTRLNKKVLDRSIEDRPAVVQQRQHFGNWEGDLVKAKRDENEPALMTLTERVSRLEILVKLPNYHARTCRQALEKTLADYGPQYFKTITFDNGSEFADLSQVKETEIYFAHPYSPWERGTNENLNGQLREFFPKGKSLGPVNVIEPQVAQDTLNHRPRKLLDYHCPAELLPGLAD